MAEQAPSSAKPCRRRVQVTGTVQGVGLRPFIFRLTARLGLAGTVRNTSGGVEIEVEGPRAAVEQLISAVLSEAPPLAAIDAVQGEEIPTAGGTGFAIIGSSGDAGGEGTSVPPDVATCAACLRELRDPADPRYRYPFINCTDCGPRFTIVSALPYDRPQTTMAGFELCARCRSEYLDIRTRRFHAQPVACPECGPRVVLVDAGGHPLAAADPVARCIELLAAGHIGAIKGLGGFHLACDATSAAAVQRLRERKQRPHKPFAVMARDVEVVRALAELSEEERRHLEGWRRPILLLRARGGSQLVPRRREGVRLIAEAWRALGRSEEGACREYVTDERHPQRLSGPARTGQNPRDEVLAPQVGGSSRWVGVMLPYTPLQHLLLEGPCAALVMTSGNRAGEPITKDNEEALGRLAGIADFFLLHDRPILVRADDSVGRLRHDGLLIMRRSRGYVPQAIELPSGGPPVLAVGGDLKSSPCLTRGRRAVLGPYIGDLEHPRAAELLPETVEHLRQLLDVSPRLVVHDLHPDYQSTRFAESLDPLPRLAVQHHHAHALACMADNGRAGAALCLALDGQGYGTDGSVWGGELLRVDGLAMERVGHLGTLSLPGGDRAAVEPWRVGVAALVQAFGAAQARSLVERLRLGPDVSPAVREGVLHIAAAAGAAPQTTSAGRLFDAAAALLGLRQRISFEGQAAIELEQAAATAPDAAPYPWSVEVADGRPLVVDLAPGLRALVEEVLRGVDRGAVAGRFHRTLAAALLDACAVARERTGLDTICLSGGVMQNVILHQLLAEGLGAAGFTVLLHRRTSPADGCLALGQAWAGVLHLAGGAG